MVLCIICLNVEGINVVGVLFMKLLFFSWEVKKMGVYIIKWKVFYFFEIKYLVDGFNFMCII